MKIQKKGRQRREEMQRAALRSKVRGKAEQESDTPVQIFLTVSHPVLLVIQFQHGILNRPQVETNSDPLMIVPHNGFVKIDEIISQRER